MRVLIAGVALVLMMGCGGADAPAIVATVEAGRAGDLVDAGRAEASPTHVDAGCRAATCDFACGDIADGCGSLLHCGPCAVTPVPEAAPADADVDAATDVSQPPPPPCVPSCSSGCTNPDGTGGSDGCGGVCRLNGGGVCTSLCAPTGGSCVVAQSVPDPTCCSGHCGPYGACL